MHKSEENLSVDPSAPTDSFGHHVEEITSLEGSLSEFNPSELQAQQYARPAAKRGGPLHREPASASPNSRRRRDEYQNVLETLHSARRDVSDRPMSAKDDPYEMFLQSTIPPSG